jgi:hypothetical protein
MFLNDLDAMWWAMQMHEVRHPLAEEVKIRWKHEVQVHHDDGSQSC